ncbi:O-antigen ligase family protein [Acinetobacter modestus]|uniref:O-antigen ligase family protein n=1 Tax=Acinetobacter modestus TaxID=1776740 RepID=UPI00202EE633|nr:O-antigen ligase family protein [Acinetobacter modestus]MCM1960719.1 O-antigen ligase family protein [Acinetobacter modestus]
MKIKKDNIFGFFLWFGLVSLIISPSLSTVFSLPRLDTGLMPFYLLLSLSLMFLYKLERAQWSFLVYFLLLISCAFLSLVLNFSFPAFVDVCFFSFFLFLFLFTALYTHQNIIVKIRLIIFVLSLLIIIGFFSEVLLGIQLVNGNDQLEVSEGAFKGFFFNTNDQAVVSTSLCAAISFFYIINENRTKIRIFGYMLLIFLGVVVFVSASRAALLGYLLTVLLTLFLNSGKLMKIGYLSIFSFFSIFIFNKTLLIPLLNFLSGFSWLERSVERFQLALFSLDEDNSVGYRTEIYQKFAENFKILWLGYGPRNYEGYFKEYPLSYSLGYTNPHSFFIEIYLAFGFFALIIFLAFLIKSCHFVVFSKLDTSQKTFYFFTILLFSWLVWVPSSILRLPLVWYPIFLILIYVISINQTAVKTFEGRKNDKAFI